MDLGAALLALTVNAGIKLVVMVFAARLLLRFYGALKPVSSARLWYLVPEADRPELRILSWALVLFFASETVCGLEIYVLMHSSPLLGCLHGLLSGLGMGFFAVGMGLFLDKRLVRFGEAGCQVNRVCKGCTKISQGWCKFEPTLLLLATFGIASSIPLFFAPTTLVSADPRRFILPFPRANAWYDISFLPWLKSVYPAYRPTADLIVFPTAVQQLEFRVLPALAIVAFVGAVFSLKSSRVHLGTQLTLFAVGVLTYAYFELVLYRGIENFLIGIFAHELAEFWFLLLLAEFLARAFPAKREAADPGGGAVTPDFA